LEENVVITFFTTDGRILKKENITTNSMLKEFDLTGKSQIILYSIVGEKINHTGRIVVR